MTRQEIFNVCETGEPDPKFAPIVKWISDSSHIGKIRLNAHGEAGRVIFMSSAPSGTQGRSHDMILADWFARFLINNDLVNAWFKDAARAIGTARGISTISLSLCHAGKDGETNPKDKAVDPSSAIKKVATYLKDQGFRSIEVTGTTNVVAVRPDEQGMKVLAEEIMNKQLELKPVDFNSLSDRELATMVTENYHSNPGAFPSLSQDSIDLINRLTSALIAPKAPIGTPRDALIALAKELNSRKPWARL